MNIAGEEEQIPLLAIILISTHLFQVICNKQIFCSLPISGLVCPHLSDGVAFSCCSMVGFLRRIVFPPLFLFSLVPKTCVKLRFFIVASGVVIKRLAWRISQLARHKQIRYDPNRHDHFVYWLHFNLMGMDVVMRMLCCQCYWSSPNTSVLNIHSLLLSESQINRSKTRQSK